MQSSTIASQSALGAKLLSQALKSASANLSSANPPKEPITIEATDVPVEEDPIDIDTQTVDSPARQTIDGKKFICSFYSSIAIIN